MTPSGDFPWRDVGRADVRGLVLQGFSAAEVAHIAGTSIEVAQARVTSALADMRREERRALQVPRGTAG